MIEIDWSLHFSLKTVHPCTLWLKWTDVSYNSVWMYPITDVDWMYFMIDMGWTYSIIDLGLMYPMIDMGWMHILELTWIGCILWSTWTGCFLWLTWTGCTLKLAWVRHILWLTWTVYIMIWLGWNVPYDWHGPKVQMIGMGLMYVTFDVGWINTVDLFRVTFLDRVKNQVASRPR